MDKCPRIKGFITKHKQVLTTSAVLAALAAAVFVALGFKGQYLLLRNEQSGNVLLCYEIADSEYFSVSYTHSVNKSLVTESYQVRGSDIYLTELRYSAFGAGMPTEPEDGQTLAYEDGEMVISGFERNMPYLCYSVGRIAGHELHLREESIPLDSLDEPGQPVLFSVIVYPRLFKLFGIYN